MRRLILLIATLVACGDKSTGSDDTGPTGTVAPPTDADGDGYTVDYDCDDNNGSVNPSVVETCDGIDNNCNGDIDEGVSEVYYPDADGDGYGNPDVPESACGLPDGYTENATDCNDSSADSYPGADERCDGEDND